MSVIRIVVAAALVAATAGAARAETVVVAGVELRLPPDWARKAKGKTTILVPTKHKGRAIEVIALDAMPPATPEAFKALVGGERLELAGVKEIMREGTKLLVASGKLVTPKRAEIAVDLLVIPVNTKAAMLVSFVGVDQDPLIKQANTEILLSARVPGPRISVAYHAPTKPGMLGPPKQLVDGITKISSVFDTNLRLPRPLSITFRECGMINAHYIPGKHAIEMCHDLYDDFIVLFTGAGMDKKKATELAAGAFLFVFLHEFGHALVGELGLAITGKGEDAADEIATLVVAKNPKAATIALAGATWFEVKAKKPDHKNAYWSSHSFDSVRFESILCLLYGSDKATHAPLMKRYKVPAPKLAKCARDTPLRLAAWKKLLAPFAVKR